MISRLIENKDSIIGVATNLDRVSAIAILRISGPIEPAHFSHVLSLSTDKIKPRFQHLTEIRDGEKVMDEILFTYFKGPHSFTGENCYELSLHGNPINVNRIQNFLIERLKLRKAEAGEFTLRALKNKKLNITQVEGLDSFLHAQTLSALDSSLMALNGSMHTSFLELRNDFLGLKTAIELNIDFAEDIGEEESLLKLKEANHKFNRSFNKLYDKLNLNPDSLRTPLVSLVGGVNAGKSTFFNSVLKDERSIVSNVKGTTRDFVSEQFYIKNQPFKLIDTAGLRDSNDQIESEGIRRTRKISEDSFFKILVINVTDPKIEEEVLNTVFDLVVFTHVDELKKPTKVFENVQLKTRSILFADQKNNKYSLLKGGPIGPTSDKSSVLLNPQNGPMGPEKSGPIEPDKGGPIGPALDKSSDLLNPQIGPIEPVSKIIEQFQIDSLKSCDINKILFPLVLCKFNGLSNGDEIIIERHIHSLNDIQAILNEFNRLMDEGTDIGLISQLSADINSSIDDLIGVYTSEDMLNNIFSNFCIGK